MRQPTRLNQGKPKTCLELTQSIIDRAAGFGLTDRKITSLRGWYIDLDCADDGPVAAQLHEVAGPLAGRALAIGDPGEDWPGSGPFEQICLQAFGSLSGDFGPNKNWLRGIKNFDHLEPAKVVFVPHALLGESADGHMHKHLEVLLRYAAEHRC